MVVCIMRKENKTMREIEFRGKLDGADKWVYGYYYGGYNWADFIISNEGFEHRQRVIPETICQYTGLKDKNGTKIFEGDIVKWGHVAGGLENPIRIARVDLFPSLQFEIIENREKFFKPIFSYGNFIYTNTEKYLEVIGNLHDNPEFLKGE